MAASAAGLEVRGLGVERGDACLVDGLSFSAPGHSLTQLQGPNGSGKTTVLRTLAGLVTPSAGSVRWRGVAAGADPGFTAALNFVGHLPGLSAELSARENLDFLARLAPRPHRDIDRALARLDATSYADRPVRQLSAGQRQRIALARLLVFERPLWMLDEPFTALDTSSRATLEGIIDDHVACGGVVVIATHQAFSSRHPTRAIALGGAGA